MQYLFETFIKDWHATLVGDEEQVFHPFAQGGDAGILQINVIFGKNLADTGENAGLVRAIVLRVE